MSAPPFGNRAHRRKKKEQFAIDRFLEQTEARIIRVGAIIGILIWMAGELIHEIHEIL